MRHRIANALYALASRIDQPGHCDISGDGLEFGDYDHGRSGADLESGQFQIHTRPGTPVSAHFKPGRFTYSSLHVGRGAYVTIFLNREVTRRLLYVLRGVDEAFTKYGDGEQ